MTFREKLKGVPKSVLDGMTWFFTRTLLWILLMLGVGIAFLCLALDYYFTKCHPPIPEMGPHWCTVIEAHPPWMLLSGLVTSPVLLLLWFLRDKYKRKDIEIASDGQVTERFTRAIEQLGSEPIEVKLGGIYALERIMKDSPRDHWTIVETLTAFVRHRCPLDCSREGSPG